MLYGIVNICWIPLTGFISFLIILSAINKSVGVRKAYVSLLLRIFEYGRVSIESASNENSRIPEKKKDTDENLRLEPIKGEDSNEVSSGAGLITRDAVLLPQAQEITNDKPNLTEKEEINFDLENCLDYVKSGVEAIIEDDVTSRFQAEELKSWNMLTRTNRRYEFISWKITLIWMVGFAIRYFILMPLRVLVCFIGVVWLTACTAAVGNLKDGNEKREIVNKVLGHCFGVLSSAISAVITYHNEDNRPSSGICVANHTSPIDVLVLMCDTTYSLIGQRHGGFLGVLQRALARASPHIWFERGEAKDRHTVAERLRQHVSDPNNPPILIFPEGTCINNTSVMQFKKGSFEVGGVIYPVAIKYDPRFGDAFWNSSKYSMMQYLYMMMTSWAIVCDVWYLPPMYRQDGESAIDFANRVKGVIAKQGGLVDLVWDGQLKRMKPKKEWKEIQQVEFANRLKSD
ncbi:glycerol-3-phosphate acyltransferase 3 isoform X2 [Drosophila novamexicana]|uniref:glycerol-3-phosphate acyltransferase 3 isoform X2 n=1 Tax=Drosophila novamexicana TaxID=47314 RepID=UPI0011E5DAA3|nr:glycerol-3-phosphate acyltransferase 3 isoform X2 [Drosophila novamexicana]